MNILLSLATKIHTPPLKKVKNQPKQLALFTAAGAQIDTNDASTLTVPRLNETYSRERLTVNNIILGLHL